MFLATTVQGERRTVCRHRTGLSMDGRLGLRFCSYPHGIGWGLWNFRGSFGLIDSERKDIEYEDLHGHKLDRKLLTLLQKY